MASDEAIDVERARSLQPATTTRRVVRWVLVDGSRSVLSLAFAAATFAVAFAVAASGVVPLTRGALVAGVLSRFVGGTIPFITIVAAVNQIVLQMDLGPIWELRRQMDDMREFRSDVEDATGASVAPATPTDFLQHLGTEIAVTSERLLDVDAETDAAREEAATVGRVIGTESRRLTDHLTSGSVDAFRQGAFLLDYDSGRHLYALRTLRTAHGDALSDEASEALDDLESLIQHVDVARQYFKTLHTEHELGSLSRAILLVGLPAIVGGGLASLAYPRLVALAGSHLALAALVAGVLTVLCLPYLVVVAYMLRVATIARQTADFGPFVDPHRNE